MLAARRIGPFAISIDSGGDVRFDDGRNYVGFQRADLEEWADVIREAKARRDSGTKVKP